MESKVEKLSTQRAYQISPSLNSSIGKLVLTLKTRIPRIQIEMEVTDRDVHFIFKLPRHGGLFYDIKEAYVWEDRDGNSTGFIVGGI